MNRDYVIHRRGRDFILYAGLLDEAHRRGLHLIRTTLVQIPTPHNGHTAICTATVRLVDQNGVVRQFAALGDANPTNVNPMVATAIIRMAETRAKARALRDAVDVGAELIDELSDSGHDIELPDPPPAAARRPPSPPRPSPSGRPTAPGDHERS